MREITTTEEIQNISLGILRYIKDVCDKNGILYYLDAGTALGAIRHSGFIPWDDDVDICMLRDDYEKFLEFVSTNPDSIYELTSVETIGAYSLPLPKVVDKRTTLKQLKQNEIYNLGVYVDIFVYDNIPDNNRERETFFRKQKKLQKRWQFFQYRVEKVETLKSFIHLLIQLLLKPLKLQRRFAVELNEYSKTYNGRKTECVGSMNYVVNRDKEIYPRDWFGNGVSKQFEDDIYPVPCKYDNFLKLLYGDYMKMPPESERVSHHATKIYWK